MNSTQVWKSELYDQKLSFVSVYGKGLVELLAPSHGESILDLGCGTGDLANEISKAGATVTGMDLSTDMIDRAKEKFPDIDFKVGNAEEFYIENRFDAVFSNAALHWMKHADHVVRNIWNALNQGGRFVAEFGGRGNVEVLIRATSEVLLDEYGIDASGLIPWYFPSIGEYSTILEQQGFRVTYAIHYDRPTQMEDGENGLNHWLTGFADDFFKAIPVSEKQAVLSKIAEKSREDLFRDGSWFVDYKRIRIRAIKD